MAKVRARHAQKTGVLILGNFRPALAIARSLKRAGYRIVVNSEGPEPFVQHSRHVDGMWRHPPLARGQREFLDAFDDYLRGQPDLRFVFPVLDGFVNLLADESRWIPEDRVIVSPAAATVRTFHDKARSLQLAQALDVPTLPFGTALHYGELLPLAAQIGFPLVVRPLGGPTRLCGRKSLICGSEQELRAFLPAWPAGVDRLLLQRYAPGERHNIFFGAFQGEIVRAVQTRILRTDALDGTGLAVDGVTIEPSPHLRELCERLLRATRYTGIGNAQFIVDPRTGASCFLGLNARVGGSQVVTEAIGMDLGLLAVELASAAERPVEGEPFRYGVGFRYAWLVGDLAGLKRSLDAGDIGSARGMAVVRQKPRKPGGSRRGPDVELERSSPRPEGRAGQGAGALEDARAETPPRAAGWRQFLARRGRSASAARGRRRGRGCGLTAAFGRRRCLGRGGPFTRLGLPSVMYPGLFSAG